MGVRENFQKLIERKQGEIRELEIQLREAQAYLQALQDSYRFLPKDTENNGPVHQEIELRAGSTLAKVRDILKHKGSPAHVNEILQILGKNVDTQTKVSLVGTLGSYSRKGKVFTRPAPNTFGLKEFSISLSDNADELPEEFGKMDS